MAVRPSFSPSLSRDLGFVLAVKFVLIILASVFLFSRDSHPPLSSRDVAGHIFNPSSKTP